MERMTEAGRRDSQPADFGRVDPDGTVYVRTADGERSVGQVPDVSAQEALAFFVKRYSALELEVDLLSSRIESGTVSPDDATHAVKKIRGDIDQARAVGDLDGLLERLGTLEPKIAEHRAAKRAERTRITDEARAAKEQMVSEAERLATSNDWRGGVNRFRDLLERWKDLPRLDRGTDDALWHRFSSARTTYTKRRKAQFAQQAERREQAKVTKQRLIKEAEKIADSTDWGPTTGAFKALMQQWKAAGPAPRDVEDDLWQQFRGLQDQFFTAKEEVHAEQDAEFRANGQAKEALLAEWEPQIDPATDLDGAKAAYRSLLERWNEIGKVPRDAIKPLDNRIRRLESAIKAAEDDQWRRNNPEARARAEDTAAKLREQIATCEDDVARAESRGDARCAAKAREAADTYRQWLAQAEAAASDFGG